MFNFIIILTSIKTKTFWLKKTDEQFMNFNLTDIWKKKNFQIKFEKYEFFVNAFKGNHLLNFETKRDNYIKNLQIFSLKNKPNNGFFTIGSQKR